MADERVALLRLRFEASKSDVDRVKQQLSTVERQLDTFAKQSQTVNSALAKQALEMQRAASVAAGQGKAYDAMTRGTSDLAASTAQATTQQQQLTRAIEETGVVTQQTLAEYRAFQRENRLQTFAVRSVTSAIPGGGGELGQFATGAFDLLDTIPKLNLSMRTLKESVVSNVQAIGGAGVGLVGGLIALTLIMNEGAKQAQVYAEQVRAAFGDYRQISDLVRSGTSEQIQAEIDKQRIAVESARAQRDAVQGILTGFEAELNKNPILRAAAEASGALGIFNVQLKTTREELDKASQETTSAESRLRQLEAALGSGQVAANDAAAAEAELAKAREEALGKIAALRQQRAQLEADADERALDAAIDRGIREKRANEDLERTLEQQRETHNARLQSIEVAGQERIEALRQNGLKRLSQFDDATSKLQGRLAEQITSDNERLRKLNADYMAGEVASTQKYRDDELKRTKNFNKERVRLLEDLNNQLLDAQEGNDVIAFIQAQRAAETRLKRQSEDFDDESRERAERFLAERRESQARYQERLAEIQSEAQARQQAIQDELTARQAARREIESEIAAAADAEKARIKEQQDAQQQAFEDQLARDAETRRIQRERQAEDESLRRGREQDALNRQLRAIDTRIAMEADAAKLIVQFGQNGARIIGGSHIAMAQQVANAFATTAQQLRSSITSGSTFAQSLGAQFNLPSASISASRPSARMVAFAAGGVADRPTFGMFGERPGYAEAFIPFRKSEGLEAALAKMGMGGQSVNFNAPITVGDGVSQQQVKAAMTEAVMGLLDGLTMARGVA